MLQARSEGLDLERKSETGGMWLLARGMGGEVDISAEAENSELLQQKKLALKVSSDMVPYSELSTICKHH